MENLCVSYLHQTHVHRSKDREKSVHERKKPFKCNDCGTAFSQKGDLKIHIEQVHEGKKLFK